MTKIQGNIYTMQGVVCIPFSKWTNQELEAKPLTEFMKAIVSMNSLVFREVARASVLGEPMREIKRTDTALFVSFFSHPETTATVTPAFSGLKPNALGLYPGFAGTPSKEVLTEAITHLYEWAKATPQSNFFIPDLVQMYPQSVWIDEMLATMALPNFYVVSNQTTPDHGTKLAKGEPVARLKAYAGIGSRETPKEILHLMGRIAIRLEEEGYTLTSGGADGADDAFARHVQNKMIFLPWNNFNGRTGIVKGSCAWARDTAMSIHPAWDRCSQGAQKLHTRNIYQIHPNGNEDTVSFVVCYTKNGAEIGGTATAIRLAKSKGVEVINLGSEDQLLRMKKWLGEI